jgi:hypothetical protein
LHGFEAALRNEPYRYVCFPGEPIDVSEDWRRIGAFGHPDLGDLPTASRQELLDRLATLYLLAPKRVR